MKIFGLFALAESRLICGSERGDENCFVTCREGGLHWSITGKCFFAEKRSKAFQGLKLRPSSLSLQC